MRKQESQPETYIPSNGIKVTIANNPTPQARLEYQVVQEVFPDFSDPASVAFLKRVITECVFEDLRNKGKLR